MPACAFRTQAGFFMHNLQCPMRNSGRVGFFYIFYLHFSAYFCYLRGVKSYIIVKDNITTCCNDF